MEFIARRSWMRMSMSLIMAVILCMQLAPSRASAQSIPRITVDIPSSGSVISDDFFPRVSVYSLDPVSSVYVIIAEKRYDLPKISSVCSTTCQYGGVLKLSDLPRGTLKAVFHADNGIDADLTVTYTLNNPPGIQVTSPLPFAVVAPSAPLSAACTDDEEGGCRELTAKVKGVTLASGVDRLEQTLDLTAYDGKKIDFQLEALDALSQKVLNTHPVYVESNPKLQPVEQGEGLLLDADEGRIVYWDAYYHRIVVKDRISGEEKALPLVVAQQWNLSVRLTPTGVIGTARDVAGAPYLVIRDGYIANGRDPMGKLRAFEWHNDELSDMPMTGLAVTGTFAAYKQTSKEGNDTNRLMIRDLLTNEEREVDVTDDRSYFLTEQGELFYAKSGKIHRYSYVSGITEPISQADNALFSSPVADSGTVLYTKNERDVVMLKDGQETVLEGANMSGGYLTAGGWIAFARLNDSGIRQYWARSPEGVEEVIAAIDSDSSRLDAIAPDGSVTFTDNGTLYMSRNGQQGRSEPERLTLDAAKSFYRGGWNIYLGAAWYTAADSVDPEPEPVLESLLLNVPDTLELEAGELLALKVEGVYSDESREEVTLGSSYESADASVVSVSAKGELTAVEQGETVITVSYGNLSAVVTVVVPEPDTPGPSEPTADLDGDGIVGPNDLIEFMRALGTTPASMHYDVRVDFDHNGIIDLQDAAVFYYLYKLRK